MTSVPIDRVTLDWIKLAVAERVSAEFAASVWVDVQRNVVWNDLVYKLSAYVLADKLPPDVVTERNTFRHEIPASPWQQFKALHADRWWLRLLVRWRPARMVEHIHTGELTVHLERFHAYPRARVEHQLGTAVRQFMLSREIRWDEA